MDRSNIAKKKRDDITSDHSSIPTEKQYEALFTSMRESILVTDGKKTILNCNPAFAQLFGYSKQEILKQKPEFIYALVKDYKKVSQLIRKCPHDKLYLEKIIFQRKDGTIFPGEVTFSFLKDNKNRKIAIIGIVRNISDKVTADEERLILKYQHQEQKKMRFLAQASALFSSSLELEQTLDTVANLIVPVFADWCTIEIADEKNDLHNVALLHKDPTILNLLKNIRNKYPPSQQNLGTYHTVRTGKSKLFKTISPRLLKFITQNEEHYQILQKAKLNSAILVPLISRGKIIGAMAFNRSRDRNGFDTDDLILAEELAYRIAIAVDNARLYEQAKEGIKVRDEFLNIASHELKTPLTSLQLQMQILQKMLNEEPNSFLAEDLDTMLVSSNKQIKRLSYLVNDLLDVSRMSNKKFDLKIEKVDLSEIAHEVIDRFDETIKNSGSQVVLHNNKKIVGFWDRSRIDQVITNLLSNAVKYGEGKNIVVDIEKKDNIAMVCVKDHGVGIRQKEKSKIFNRFERSETTKRFGGVGLGLYIVNEIVKAHKGNIQIKSQEGKGSDFTVILPLKALS